MTEEVLSENQRLLARYLAMSGCSKIAVINMILDLWDEKAVIAMAQFCKENPDASPAELLEACSRISLEYPTEYEETDEDE